MYDAATDRLKDAADRAFTSSVEAHRMGVIFASPGKHAQRAYRTWRRRNAAPAGASVGMTGMTLERAVAGLAARHPEYVVRSAA